MKRNHLFQSLTCRTEISVTKALDVWTLYDLENFWKNDEGKLLTLIQNMKDFKIIPFFLIAVNLNHDDKADK